MYIVQKRSGELTKDYREILNEQFCFYEGLYTSNPEVCFTLRNNTSTKLSEVQKAAFEEFVSEDELYDAMMTLKRNKVCGCDGLSIKFYQRFWKLLRQPLHAMLQHSLTEKRLSSSARRGIISLIPKLDRDEKLLKNWRPITLLNYDYKIYAKALSNRMDTVVSELVGTQQTGFIKGRSIISNLAKTREIISYLNRRNQPGIIAVVDFEKCFNHIEYNSI